MEGDGHRLILRKLHMEPFLYQLQRMQADLEMPGVEFLYLPGKGAADELSFPRPFQCKVNMIQ